MDKGKYADQSQLTLGRLSRKEIFSMDLSTFHTEDPISTFFSFVFAIFWDVVVLLVTWGKDRC